MKSLLIALYALINPTRGVVCCYLASIYFSIKLYFHVKLHHHVKCVLQISMKPLITHFCIESIFFGYNFTNSSNIGDRMTKIFTCGCEYPADLYYNEMF